MLQPMGEDRAQTGQLPNLNKDGPTYITGDPALRAESKNRLGGTKRHGRAPPGTTPVCALRIQEWRHKLGAYAANLGAISRVKAWGELNDCFQQKKN